MYKLSYYGVAAFRIGLPDGRGILIDPFLDFGPVKAEEMPRVDCIAISHGAADHIGSGFEVAKIQNSVIYAPPAVVEFAMMKGVSEGKLFIMAQGANRKFQDIDIKAVAASHVSFIRMGEGRYMSDCPLGYIFTLPNGKKIYHTGDTAIFSDLKLFGQLYSPDIVLLPIGKFKGAITEMNPEEAALAAMWIGAKKIIPMHYDFETQADFPDRLITSLKRYKYDGEVIIMQPGETIEL